MGITRDFVDGFAPGIAIIAGADELRDDEADQLVRTIRRLHGVYFGTTAFSRKQAAAVAAARETRKSFTALEIIDACLHGLSEQQKWTLREDLCALDVPTDQLAAEARARAKALRPKRTDSPGVKIIRGKDLWKVNITGTSEDIADMKTALGDTFESAREFFFSGEKAARVVKHTNVIVTLDQLVEIVAGRGDDIQLRMTNGAMTTGARLIQDLFKALGLVTLVHPVHGPVNLYRTKRPASWKQKQMAWAEHPVCAWPDCNKPAEESQIHHIVAWKNGGHTNQANLVTLCGYHNGINNDDPSKPSTRGRMERIDGRAEWCPPWSVPI